MAEKPDLVPAPLPRRFAELCALHPPRPIKDQVDLDGAVELVDRLTALPRPTRDQEDYLETLTLLVEAYEAELELGGDVRGIAALRGLLAANGLTAADLSKLLGDPSRSLGSRILRGERELSKAHVRKLCDRFAVSADLFV